MCTYSGYTHVSSRAVTQHSNQKKMCVFFSLYLFKKWTHHVCGRSMYASHRCIVACLLINDEASWDNFIARAPAGWLVDRIMLFGGKWLTTYAGEKNSNWSEKRFATMLNVHKSEFLSKKKKKIGTQKRYSTAHVRIAWFIVNTS